MAFQNIATAQNNVYPITSWQSTANAADNTATTIITTATGAAGLYRVSVFIQCTTAGGAASTLPAVNLTWTANSQAITTGTAGGNNGNAFIAANALGGNGVKTQCGFNKATLFCDAGTAIQIATTGGTYGASFQYGIYARIEFLG